MKNKKQKNVANRSCREQDLVFDIKYFMEDFYLAKFIENGNKLRVLLDNGQKFTISVKENL